MLGRGDADLAISYFPETISALTSQGGDSSLCHALCAADHLLVNVAGRPYALADQVPATLNRKRRIVLTVIQYVTPGRVLANSNLLTVLPAHFVEATGYDQHVVTRPLPFDLAGPHVAMGWHPRNDRASGAAVGPSAARPHRLTRCASSRMLAEVV